MDLTALNNEHRQKYRRVWKGETKGARIEAQNSTLDLKKRTSAVATTTAKDGGEDSIGGGGGNVNNGKTHQEASSVKEQGKTKCELARDVEITPDVDHLMNFEAHFERYKLMRSDVLVESNAIEQVASRALDIIPRKCHRSPIYIITDSVTDEICGGFVHDGMISVGLNVTKFVVPSETDDSGESSTVDAKTLASFARLADQVVHSGLTSEAPSSASVAVSLVISVATSRGQSTMASL